MTVAERATLRQVLRASTADIHQRLEQIPAFERLLQGRASLADYLALLRGYRRFYQLAQAHLDLGYLELAALGSTLARKDVLYLLEQDLAALGAPCEDVVAEAPPHAAASAAVGWVWVVEGSALGGKVIDRSLTQLLGKSGEGRRFFTPAADMAVRWQGVCAVLERYGQHDERRDAVMAGALDAFACIEQSLMEATQ